jgi:hypothetical protein
VAVGCAGGPAVAPLQPPPRRPRFVAADAIREEANELVRIGSVKRALRSKSGRAPAQFSRSHLTGHSLAASATTGTGGGASTERFTLRLPEHMHLQSWLRFGTSMISNLDSAILFSA